MNNGFMCYNNNYVQLQKNPLHLQDFIISILGITEYLRLSILISNLYSDISPNYVKFLRIRGTISCRKIR